MVKICNLDRLLKYKLGWTCIRNTCHVIISEDSVSTKLEKPFYTNFPFQNYLNIHPAWGNSTSSSYPTSLFLNLTLPLPDEKPPIDYELLYPNFKMWLPIIIFCLLCLMVPGMEKSGQQLPPLDPGKR